MAIRYQDLYVGSPTGDWYLRLYYDSISQSVANNQSVLNFHITLRGTNPYGWVEFDRRDAWIGGNHFSLDYHQNPGEHTLGSAAYTVNHAANGTAGFSVGFGISTSYVLNGSATMNLTLPPIPRASDLTAFTDFNIEDTWKIGVNKKYSGFRDDLQIYCGSNLIKSISNYENGGTILFTAAEKQTIFNLMKTVNSTVFTATITTFNGTTKIGSSSRTAVGTIYNAAPLISSFTWKALNHLDLSNNQTIIKNYTKIGVTLTAAIPQKGAALDHYQITCGSKSASCTAIDKEVQLENVDDALIRVYAVDSRGNATEISRTATSFLNYQKPYIQEISTVRGEGGIGHEVTLHVKGNMWAQNFGLVNNQLTAAYFYKERNAGTWTQGTTVITIEQKAEFNCTVKIKGDIGANGFSNKNFDIRMILTDKLDSFTKEDIVSQGNPHLAFHDNGVAIGGFYDEKVGGTLQIYSSALHRMISSDWLIFDDPEG